MHKKIFPALILITVGLYFLARNMGLLPHGLGRWLAQWWPIVPLIIGVSMLVNKR